MQFRDFLSFRELSLPGLDPRLNVVVGPNGAGKTNLVRAVRAMTDVLAGGDAMARRADWEGAGHSGADSFSLSADLIWDALADRELFLSYLVAAICTDCLGEVHNHLEGVDALGRWLWGQADRETLQRLCRGRLVVERSSMGWSSHCEAEPDGTKVIWWIDGRTLGSVLGAAQLPPSVPTSKAWEALQSRCPQLGDFVQGQAPAPQGFNWLAALLEAAGKGRVEWQAKPRRELWASRRFFEQAGFAAWLRDPATYFANLRHLFWSLMRQGLVVTADVRRVTPCCLQPGQGAPAEYELADGEQLLLHLFHLKNGNREQREGYAAIQKLFKDLTGGLTFEVTMVPPIRQPGQNEATEIPLQAVVLREGREVPLAFAGAGIAEAVFLSTLAFSGEGRLVLLDEPALNLHPAAQRRLLRALEENKPGHQYVLITHSPYLIPEEPRRVIRFVLEDGATRAQRLAEVGRNEPQRKALWRELGRSADARGLFFASGVVLVEGETEAGALPVWWAKAGHTALEGENIVFYPVGGSHFATVQGLLEAFRIPWVVLCDGDALREVLRRMGHKVEEEFAGLRQEAARRGVFTCNEQEDETLESLPEIMRLQSEAHAAVGKSKVRQGRWIAEEIDCPPAVQKVLEQALDTLRRRMQRRESGT